MQVHVHGNRSPVLPSVGLATMPRDELVVQATEQLEQVIGTDANTAHPCLRIPDENEYRSVDWRLTDVEKRLVMAAGVMATNGICINKLFEEKAKLKRRLVEIDDELRDRREELESARKSARVYVHSLIE